MTEDMFWLTFLCRIMREWGFTYPSEVVYWAEVYSGRSDVGNFTFQSKAAASLYSRVLLNQVFLDDPSGL